MPQVASGIFFSTERDREITQFVYFLRLTQPKITLIKLFTTFTTWINNVPTSIIIFQFKWLMCLESLSAFYSSLSKAVFPHLKPFLMHAMKTSNRQIVIFYYWVRHVGIVNYEWKSPFWHLYQISDSWLDVVWFSRLFINPESRNPKFYSRILEI